MCTAILSLGSPNLFGRSLDISKSFGESLLVLPRDFVLDFSNGETKKRHSAIIGVGIRAKGSALLFDGINEHGLAVSALNFPVFCSYYDEKPDKINLASFEFIPYVLSKCKSLRDFKALAPKINLTKKDFSKSHPKTPLHFIVGDKSGSVVYETTTAGAKIYDNPTGVLTNSPGFEFHLRTLPEIASLSPDAPKNKFLEEYGALSYSNGMGAFGLAGDFSSNSRFKRACFLARYCKVRDKSSSVNRFFDIFDNLKIPYGAVADKNGLPMYTRYVSCMDLDNFSYYFKSCECHRIFGVKPKLEDKNGKKIKSYSLAHDEDIKLLN